MPNQKKKKHSEVILHVGNFVTSDSGRIQFLFNPPIGLRCKQFLHFTLKRDKLYFHQKCLLFCQGLFYYLFLFLMYAF